VSERIEFFLKGREAVRPYSVWSKMKTLPVSSARSRPTRSSQMSVDESIVSHPTAIAAYSPK